MSLARPAVALAGFAALAVAIGVGRFAFTPLLPLMHDESGVSMSQGALLASANYIGYLAGAVTAIGARVSPGCAIRVGLALIAAATAAMAVCDTLAGWLALRTVAGIASAWVLVFGSAWSLERLSGSPRLRGLVFSGVGAGIALTGLLVIGVVHAGAGASRAWQLIGLVALVAAACVWRAFATPHRDSAGALHAPSSRRRLPWRLIVAYGAFGFGYIIPATFLPVMARGIIGDGASFAWAWPVFGLAAAVSTLVSTALSARVSTQTVWIAGHVIMAGGMLLPVIDPGVVSVMAAALLVGCTFMVITLAGLQRAREVAGGDATRLIAAMTSAFAIGQILGPLAAVHLPGANGGFGVALAIASASLLLAAGALLKPETTRAQALPQPGLAVRAARDGRRT